MAQMPNKEDIEGILTMLGEAKIICLDATIKVNRLKALTAFEYEGVPELVRAQLQNAVSLCVQAEKIWTVTLQQTEMQRVNQPAPKIPTTRT